MTRRGAASVLYLIVVHRHLPSWIGIVYSLCGQGGGEPVLGDLVAYGQGPSGCTWDKAV